MGDASTKITVGPPFFNAVNIPLGLLLLALTGIGPLIAWRKRVGVEPQAAVRGAGGCRRRRRRAAVRARHARRCTRSSPTRCAASSPGTIVQEFYKGIRARQSIHGESVVTAFVHLVARNRRRYGGYIVHAGIVMLFAAFAGMAFKTRARRHAQDRRGVRDAAIRTATSGGS